jgi:hypothetical protein
MLTKEQRVRAEFLLKETEVELQKAENPIIPLHLDAKTLRAILGAAIEAKK